MWSYISQLKCRSFLSLALWLSAPLRLGWCSGRDRQRWEDTMQVQELPQVCHTRMSVWMNCARFQGSASNNKYRGNNVVKQTCVFPNFNLRISVFPLANFHHRISEFQRGNLRISTCVFPYFQFQRGNLRISEFPSSTLNLLISEFQRGKLRIYFFHHQI